MHLVHLARIYERRSAVGLLLLRGLSSAHKRRSKWTPFEFENYQVTHRGHGREKNNRNQDKKTLNLCLHKKKDTIN